ncbi:hypothetical protein LOKVESSMR4R_00847 [Yoonia vestfoldensis]|jgi:hypothetical protein|uniref:Uncharacterized protein n=2 Tax=Yoonia vestfoldensis TaxID=245188 RepID=A0A1Y0E9V1_9RHOB|nr:hypothetical protein LOKVESSMR4R_00847 [Yoonia vestfoldensis]
MDRQTLMLELKGLSQVVNADVRDLVYKRHAVSTLADDYEAVNPFHEMLDHLESDLIGAIDLSIYENLSREAGSVFAAQWNQMSVYQQFQYLEDYVRGVSK